MSKVLSPGETERYQGIISSIAATALALSEGVTKETGFKKSSLGSTVRERNIHVYIVENRVTIDLFINVIYGYSVPEVACAVQERIKKEVEAETGFKVESINVNVSNVVFR